MRILFAVRKLQRIGDLFESSSLDLGCSAKLLFFLRLLSRLNILIGLHSWLILLVYYILSRPRFITVICVQSVRSLLLTLMSHSKLILLHIGLACSLRLHSYWIKMHLMTVAQKWKLWRDMVHLVDGLHSGVPKLARRHLCLIRKA